MKKFVVGVLTFAIVTAIIIDSYFLFIRGKLSSDAQETSQSSTTTTSSSPSSTSKTSTRKYKDGTYTGSSVSTQWGNVQVQAVVTNGKLTKINVLKYPNDNGHDKQINSQALPTYKSEAITAQSANIKLISGASETYKGFTGSLKNALKRSVNDQ